MQAHRGTHHNGTFLPLDMVCNLPHRTFRSAYEQFLGEEVCAGVACDAQFREDNQTCVLCYGPVYESLDSFGVFSGLGYCGFRYAGRHPYESVIVVHNYFTICIVTLVLFVTLISVIIPESRFIDLTFIFIPF